MIAAYHQLFQIEKSFRMAKSDLQARPIYHRIRDSIEAHLTIVFAALAVSRWIEHQTGRSIRKFVKTARRYRTVQIQAGPHTITAASPLPGDLRQAINASQPAHQELSQLRPGPPGSRSASGQLKVPDDQVRATPCGPPCRGQVVRQRERPVLPVADPGRGLGQRSVRPDHARLLAPLYLQAMSQRRPQVVTELMPEGRRDARLPRRAAGRHHRAAGDEFVVNI